MSDGTAKRPFCYITDAVVGYLMILIRGKSGEAYNVSNSDGFRSIKELAEIISKQVTPPVEVVIKGRRNDGFIENVLNYANKPNENKLRNLGWEHLTTVEDGFKRVIQAISKDRS